MADVTVSLALQGEVDLAWPHVADFIQDACDEAGGESDAAMLWHECRSGRAFLMVAMRNGKPIMGSVWRFENWSTGTVLKCIALGGIDIMEWVGLARERAMEMAKTGRAKRIVVFGRKGWQRFFRDSAVMWQAYEMRVD